MIWKQTFPLTQTGKTRWSWFNLQTCPKEPQIFASLTLLLQIPYFVYLTATQTHLPSVVALSRWLFHSLQISADRRWKRTWSCWWSDHSTGCPTSSPGYLSHWCCLLCHNWQDIKKKKKKKKKRETQWEWGMKTNYTEIWQGRHFTKKGFTSLYTQNQIIHVKVPHCRAFLSSSVSSSIYSQASGDQPSPCKTEQPLTPKWSPWPGPSWRWAGSVPI